MDISHLEIEREQRHVSSDYPVHTSFKKSDEMNLDLKVTLNMLKVGNKNNSGEFWMHS